MSPPARRLQPQSCSSLLFGAVAAAAPAPFGRHPDTGDILAVSRCVNGWIEGQDPVGWADRRTRYLNCMALGDQLLALTTSTPTDPLEELLKMK